MPSSVKGGVPAQVARSSREELVGNAEGQCGPTGGSRCSPPPGPGHLHGGKETVIVQNSVSQ